MNLIRSYSSGLPNSWAGSGASWHPATTTTWHSMKATWSQMASGSHDATVISFLNSVPTGKDLWLTFGHEPENDGGISLRVACRVPALLPGSEGQPPRNQGRPLYMDWTWNPTSGRNPEDWHPGAGYMDFMGIDTYNTYYWPMVGSPTKWDAPVQPRAGELLQPV